MKTRVTRLSNGENVLIIYKTEQDRIRKTNRHEDRVRFIKKCSEWAARPWRIKI